jgi:hypothetical protein
MKFQFPKLARWYTCFHNLYVFGCHFPLSHNSAIYSFRVEFLLFSGPLFQLAPTTLYQFQSFIFFVSPAELGHHFSCWLPVAPAQLLFCSSAVCYHLHGHQLATFTSPCGCLVATRVWVVDSEGRFSLSAPNNRVHTSVGWFLLLKRSSDLGFSIMKSFWRFFRCRFEPNSSSFWTLYTWGFFFKSLSFKLKNLLA